MLRKLSVFALLLTLLSNSAIAQEEPDKDDEDKASALERLIYVPYKKLRDVFDKQDASVVVPYAEYLKLSLIHI